MLANKHILVNIFLIHIAISSYKQYFECSKKEQNMNSMFPPTWIMVLLHLWVGPSLYVILKRHYEKQRDPNKLCLLLKVKTCTVKPSNTNLPQRKACVFPHDYLEKTVHSHRPCPPHPPGNQMLESHMSKYCFDLRWLNLGIPIWSRLRT